MNNKKFFLTLGFIVSLLAVSFCCYFTASSLRNHVLAHDEKEGQLHRFLAQNLMLTPEQRIKIQEIEDIYQEKRWDYEQEMKRLNGELAKLIIEQNKYTPEMQEKIDTLHNAMMELQKITLEHIFAMYPHLTEEQKQKLQKFVADALVKTEQ